MERLPLLFHALQAGHWHPNGPEGVQGGGWAFVPSAGPEMFRLALRVDLVRTAVIASWMEVAE